VNKFAIVEEPSPSGRGQGEGLGIYVDL
jgi:hypothetical protein